MYTGIDIVPSLIEQNIHQWTGNEAHRFMVADITVNPLPTADLILCRDCLVHLSFAHIDAALANFRASGARWLLTTTFPMIEENVDCEDGDWRALNLTLPAILLVATQMLIGESCLEANGTWRDKSLGLWPLATTTAMSRR
ncbi:class I SAM-dependent methyltransferase [Advenella kashmirensis]|uniref:class I SAM-dependent methyltransferase n=1 Tax=Advenella kashmirensis TaxID=310575 RepID=UPI001930B850|nr:class I SAM-dependent methyltransferase [Advenella kashmirensis]